MVSYRQLLSLVESVVLGSEQPLPHQRSELIHTLRKCLPNFMSFLEYPGPRASDRSQVLSKEVRLPNAPPTILDDQDVQIALKLSEDLNLNEIDCVSLLVAAHQEWGLLGRVPLEILRLSAGLWFTERIALITTLLTLLRVAVLDEGVDNDLVVDIQNFLEELFKSGLRQRLITIIKELNRDEPAGSGGPHADRYVLDSRGTLVQRYTVVQRERLSLSQCLVFSVLVVRISSEELKDILSLLKDCAGDTDDFQSIVKLQIAYTILFVLVTALMSDALSGSQDPSVFSLDSDFRREFQGTVMSTVNDAKIEGFMNVVRLSWAVFIMLTFDGTVGRVAASVARAADAADIRSCLECACANNAFKFLLTRILRTAAFQNDDEDIIFMYNAYLHKMLTSFLSHPIGRDKAKEVKDRAMNALGSYSVGNAYESMDDDTRAQQQAIEDQAQPFICLLEVLTEVYQREPGLTDGNEALWNFVCFAGEDHSSYQTLVAFLSLLSTLASGEEGAKRVFQLLQSKAIRNVGWHILFNSLNVYEQKFKRCLQNTRALLPSFQEGDARVLVAYLRVLQRVIQNGNSVEKLLWFPDIEPLFKLLPYENVPPYLKGALRNAIATFVEVSPTLKDTVWTFLEQYDLPVVVKAPVIGNSSQEVSSQVYEMRYELNEVEARREEYPSTLSYLNLLNVLIEKETDLSDNGRRFVGIFSFVRDQVFGPFSQRAYADPVEKWQLVVACLRHFQLMLGMYNIADYDAQNAMNQLPQPDHTPVSPDDLTMHIPAIELMKDFMSGKTIFRNIMRILMLGVDKVLEDRSSQLYGPSLEEAVHLCLELVLLALERDSSFADYWRPVYQPLDVILSHESHQIVMLLQYVRYDRLPAIQQCSIKIMDILSGRMVQLVSIIMKADAAGNLIEDYANCLEARTQEFQALEKPNKDTGFLILQLLINNLARPAPNVTHLLLRFDVDGPVERTILQPKSHYSCLRVILDVLETLSNADANSVLHEFGFQLIYEVCVDGLTGGPMIELLRGEKYEFFMKHLDTFLCSPLPKRNNNQVLRISNLQQRAWLLKLFALQLHVSDMDVITDRESCRCLISQLFLQESLHIDKNNASFQNSQIQQHISITNESIYKMKVLELLDVIQFRPPETNINFPHSVLNFKEDLRVDEILGNSATLEKGGVYYYSERGDRIIDLAAFRDKLWQEYHELENQSNSVLNQKRLVDLKDAVQQLLIWGWKYNKNLEENAAQLHMLVGWSQVVEVSVSRRMEFLESRPQALFEILDASLGATTSQDCSLKMALFLTQVVLTSMAKLQEQSFLSPGGESTDNVTYIDILSSAHLSNGACHSILSKLVMAILRSESSEILRRRQYAIMLSYFQYCCGMLDPDVSLGTMRDLLIEGQDGEDDVDLQKIDKDQAELTQMNFSILKREATALVDVVAKDATQGSEVGKAMAFYVLEALLGFDQDQLFLNQIQSRGLLRACLSDINNNSYQAVLLPSAASIRRLYTLEAELALLLRVGYGYKKRGAQILFAMGILERLSSCRAVDVYLTEDSKWAHAFKMGLGLPSQHDRHHQIVSPVLRLVFCVSQLVDMSEYLEESNKVIREIIEFVVAHQGLFARILRDEDSEIHVQLLEELEIAIAILSKVWPFEERDECGIVQALFNLMCVFFSEDTESSSKYVLYIRNSERAVDQSYGARENVRKMELFVKRLQCNLVSYLYCLVTRKNLRLPISRPNIMDGVFVGNYTFGRQRQPTLKLVASLLHQATTDLERAVEEKCLLLTKIQDVNELSRHEVDEILEAYGRQEYLSASDSIRKRRYLAMIEMCSAAGYRERLTTLILHVVEHVLNIFYIHFENRLQVPDHLNQDMTSYLDKEENVGSKDDIMSLNERIVPILERLEALNEDRVGHSLKLLHRLVHSLKSRILLRYSS
ncbi:hypothetical protein SUGI_0012850 [Cryptomeria japonica]|uniref:nuclear pore complex protein NUP205 n=1 Tax=Cryptomeria japonica TaxID=3369 RepID=UPI002408E93E|nr:nuclear pore complex protein NUP205 [Cryptomeria japonica]GLJ05177.1 hypothetical protein SUGI_0012850 [Cryptomeria japonica]